MWLPSTMSAAMDIGAVSADRPDGRSNGTVKQATRTIAFAGQRRPTVDAQDCTHGPAVDLGYRDPGAPAAVAQCSALESCLADEPPEVVVVEDDVSLPGTLLDAPPETVVEAAVPLRRRRVPRREASRRRLKR